MVSCYLKHLLDYDYITHRFVLTRLLVARDFEQIFICSM